MRGRRHQSILVSILFAATAAAQQRPIFDPDDFVDPAQHPGRPLFVSRLVAGGAANAVDDYRPLHQDIAFVHLANSFYWRHVQFDYKHSEVFGDDVHLERCDCPDPTYFPTPAAREATPDAPPPSREDMVQFAWYSALRPEGRIPIPFRLQLLWSRQEVDTEVTSRTTGQISRLSGREQSFGFNGDMGIEIRGHPISGSLHYARTSSSGTASDRKQHELVYVQNLPGHDFGSVLLHMNVGIGGVSDRAGTAINIVNPRFELFRRIGGEARVNIHLVWSPLVARSGVEGWKTTHQVAFFVDRAYAKLFRIK